MKSEPDCYSIEDLKKDKKTMWDGVRNYQVRNMMRDEMRVGDLVLFYHSNTKDLGVVGTMKVVRNAYPDPTQFDPNSEHPDLKSSKEDPRWLCVDVEYKSTFKRLVGLKEMKTSKKLKSMRILQKGNRLSVTPLTKEEFDHICQLGKTNKV